VPVDEVSALDENVRKQIQALAMTRIGLGAAFLIAPGQFLRNWLGPKADSPVARMMTRYAGGRDVALGVGTALALKHDAPVRGWLEAGSMCDVTDFVVTSLALRDVRRLPAAAAAISALATAVYGRQLVSRLPT
jgi:hypothetical protein